ncbi:MAG: NYN domain-containing protein [Eubacteriales bacterium]|nr:NYN domain-containing protein [Eubacteriales bacterium]MCI7095379.1 NYN domain-containing protein [Clostridiales bacterium]MDY5677541.1 NYN domain-containing protein [Eubacteriales bacterium]
MENDKNIALFIDLDNCNINTMYFDNAIEELKTRGNIVYGKVYGVSDRKHVAIISRANSYGFDTTTPMRVKKRGSKVFDTRIFVDVMDVVYTQNIDAVCVIAAPADMVYLYSKLHRKGISVIALDNADEESREFIDDVIDIGLVDVIKPQRKSAGKNMVGDMILPADKRGAETDGSEDSESLLIDEIQQLLDNAVKNN